MPTLMFTGGVAVEPEVDPEVADVTPQDTTEKTNAASRQIKIERFRIGIEHFDLL